MDFTQVFDQKPNQENDLHLMMFHDTLGMCKKAPFILYLLKYQEKNKIHIISGFFWCFKGYIKHLQTF